MWQRLILLLCIPALSFTSAQTQESHDPFGWQKPQHETRPWARWWWFGSAVTQDEITRQLELLHQAGFGGIEIQPIYPAKDSPIEPIPFLSKKWAKMFQHTIEEAHRLNMGVDWTLGSGWPFGGPWLEPEHAARKLEINTREVSLDEPLSYTPGQDQPPLECLLLTPKDETSPVTLLEPQGRSENKKHWRIPPGDWTIHEVRIGYTGQQVKRATLGSEGPVLDHFSREAFLNYVEPFEQVLSWIEDPRPRANFNDSFEVYGANATADLFTEFENRRGYDLRPYLPIMFDKQDSPLQRRLLHDYRETIEELFYEDFCLPWREWSHKQGMQIRFQAHGSPGHLLDLYAIADIPETEGFGRHGAEIFAPKMASSAAHLTGGHLTSAETFTWQDEHFQISLDQMRRNLDVYFLAGINHIFYHGVPFSPESVPFPGWLFYASTNAGEHTTWFPHLHKLNQYITRNQSVMRKARFDAQVLLVYPIHDLFFFREGSRSHLQYATIHNTDNWLQKAANPTFEFAQALWRQGIQFDFVSDRWIQEHLEAEEGQFTSGGMNYNALIFAGCQWIEKETLQAVQRLADKQASTIFLPNYPNLVPRNEDPRIQPPGLPSSIQDQLDSNNHIIQAATPSQALEALSNLGVKTEPLAQENLEFIRFKTDSTTYYFIKNSTNRSIQKWLPFNAEGQEALLGDPITGEVIPLDLRKKEELQLRVDLKPTRAYWIAIGDNLHPSHQPKPKPTASKLELTGPWKLQWTDYEGQQHTHTLTELEDWTSIPELEYYSGQVRYLTEFNWPHDTNQALLRINQLHESADVWINNHKQGTLWTQPYELHVSNLTQGTNQLRFDVLNLPANRIIELDQQEVDWKKFYFVNIDYRPFDASEWEPLPSGILAPLQLIPLNE